MALATALIVALFFSYKAVIPAADGTFAETFKYTEYLPYLILIIVITILNILAVTTYRFRVFQMRTAVLSAIITLALQAWLVVDYISTNDTVVFRYTAVFPLVAAIFNILAARSIMSDIMVAESVNHLRTRKKNRK